MPENLPSILMISLFFGIGLIALIRVVQKRLSPVRTVKAVVVGKNTVEVFDKYAGNGKHVKYVVIFSVDGKKKSFYVSEFSYRGYKVNEKGTLTYQGDRLISFQ